MRRTMLLLLAACSEPPATVEVDLQPLVVMDLSGPVMDLSHPDLTMPADLAVILDLAMSPADMSMARDLSAPADLTTPPDLLPVVVPPAAVWWSTGGGSGVGSVTAMKGNFSIGPQ